MCCGQTSVEDLVNRYQSAKVKYSENPNNDSFKYKVNGPFSQSTIIQPKLEMSPNGKYIKFVRIVKQQQQI